MARPRKDKNTLSTRLSITMTPEGLEDFRQKTSNLSGTIVPDVMRGVVSLFAQQWEQVSSGDVTPEEAGKAFAKFFENAISAQQLYLPATYAKPEAADDDADTDQEGE